MGKKQGGENSKKVSGNAKKAEAANQKAAVDNAKKAVVEDQEWSKGAKSNAKKHASSPPSLPPPPPSSNTLSREEATAKKADSARKKAEKDALLALEEQDARPTPKNQKTAPKKSRPLTLSQLDDPSTSTSSAPALNATGIDNALDALSLTSNNAPEKIDRHPERRFKAAYAAYEARRMPEVEEEYAGLRKQQRVELIRREFERSGENPFNGANARFDSTREEIRGIREGERERVEERLGGR